MSRFHSEQEARDAGVYVSKIKSYVKREGRLTNAQGKALEEQWPSMGLNIEQGMLDLDHVFGPHTDFIGIEVHRPGVGACLADAAAANITNLKVFEHDAVEVLDTCINDASLSRVQLFFPDPWHKTRHHKRRIVQSAFVQSLRSKLAIDGHFHMATDWEPYAEHMIEVMEQAEGFMNTADSGMYIPRPEYRPTTKFEVRGQKLGHGVWDIIYKRVS